MGTSSHYKIPTTGNWGSIKRNLTSISKMPSPSKAKVKNAIGDFIVAKGGGRTVGESSYGNWTKSTKEVAGGLAEFITSVRDDGLVDTLKKIGLEELVGKPIAEFYAYLIDYLGGNSNTRNEVITRRALSKTVENLIDDAYNTEDFEETLINISAPESLERFLFEFFGNYICEQFYSTFEEFLKRKMTDERFEYLLEEICETIFAGLKNKTIDKNISRVNWNGEEGIEIIDEILETTVEIFGD